MDFKTFHEMAIDKWDNGGDIVSTYDETDFNEWLETLECDPTVADYLCEFDKLCEFYRECEEITGRKVGV